MQIDPAALSRSDSISNPKGTVPNGSVSAKTSRALISVPRLELEHAYTDLKAAIGDKWAEYKESTALFLLGMSSCAIISSESDCLSSAQTAPPSLLRVRLGSIAS